MTVHTVRPRRIRIPVMFFKRRYPSAQRWPAVWPVPRVRHRAPRAALMAATSFTLACSSKLPPELGDIPTGLRVSLITRYYDVSGMSPHDLEVAMVMRGPEVEGHPRYAATSFQIRWSFSVRASSVGCVAQTPRIELEMAEHLPRWTDRDRADEELRARWDTFFEAVRTHERGHQQRNVDGARHMLRVLGAANSAGGCTVLRESANTRMREMLAQVHNDNHRYDVQTGGGARAGVRWPPPR